MHRYSRDWQVRPSGGIAVCVFQTRARYNFIIILSFRSRFRPDTWTYLPSPLPGWLRRPRWWCNKLRYLRMSFARVLALQLARVTAAAPAIRCYTVYQGLKFSIFRVNYFRRIRIAPVNDIFSSRFSHDTSELRPRYNNYWYIHTFLSAFTVWGLLSIEVI